MQKCFHPRSIFVTLTLPPSSSTVTCLSSAGLQASASISRTSPVEHLFIFRADISRWSSFLGQALRGTAGYFLLPPHTHYSLSVILEGFSAADKDSDWTHLCCKCDTLSIINWIIHRFNSFGTRFCRSFALFFFLPVNNSASRERWVSDDYNEVWTIENWC